MGVGIGEDELTSIADIHIALFILVKQRRVLIVAQGASTHCYSSIHHLTTSIPNLLQNARFRAPVGWLNKAMMKRMVIPFSISLTQCSDSTGAPEGQAEKQHFSTFFIYKNKY